MHGCTIPNQGQRIFFLFHQLYSREETIYIFICQKADVKQEQDLELLKHFKEINPGTLKIISVYSLLRVLFETDSEESFV